MVGMAEPTKWRDRVERLFLSLVAASVFAVILRPAGGWLWDSLAGAWPSVLSGLERTTYRAAADRAIEGRSFNFYLAVMNTLMALGIVTYLAGEWSGRRAATPYQGAFRKRGAWTWLWIVWVVAYGLIYSPWIEGKTLYSEYLWRRFERNVVILSGYVKESEVQRLRSRWVRMKCRADHEEILGEIASLAAREKLDVTH